VVRAVGPMFGAANRAGKESAGEPVMSEKELYGDPHQQGAA
jgi:hypothetical protein